ncbi:MAG: hypothetical protein JO209_01975 [Acidisphaera sp.]|nr:hypothetical protein [Acidisphaera sp.]
MRKTLLSTAVAFGLAVAVPALAQTGATAGGAQPPMGGGAAASPSPGAPAATGAPSGRALPRRGGAAPAANAAPAGGMNPVTGARPGNEPGTNSSLPTSDQASNISAGDTRSPIAPRLPSPAVGGNGSPQQYLAAAKRALGQRRTGEAQQALEMAETRALDRSTAPDQANTPLESPMIAQIHHALDAIARHDMQGADQAISAAMSASG